MKIDKLSCRNVEQALREIEDNADKLQYLADMRRKVEKIQNCFHSNRLLDYRNLIANSYYDDDECPEFINFLRKTLLENSTGNNDRRDFNNDKIFSAVKKKIFELDKLHSFIEEEIDLYSKLHSLKKKSAEKKRDTAAQSELSKIIKKELDNIDLGFEIGKSYRDLLQPYDKPGREALGAVLQARKEKRTPRLPKFKWKGNNRELADLFEMLFNVGIIPKIIYDKRELIMKEYFEQDNDNAETINYDEDKNSPIEEKNLPIKRKTAEYVFSR